MNRELKQATFPSELTGRSNHAELRPRKTLSHNEQGTQAGDLPVENDGTF